MAIKRSEAIFAIVFLMLGCSSFSIPLSEARLTPFIHANAETSSTSSEFIITVNPDESIEVGVKGKYQQAMAANDTVPINSATFNLAVTPSGANLTKIEGGFMLKMGPEYSSQLSTLNLDILIHSEGTISSADISIGLPDYVGINGTITSEADEATPETTIDFDLNVKVWYSLLPMEAVQDLVQNFPLYKTQLVSEATKSGIMITDLNLLESNVGPSSASLRITGSVKGDLYGELASMLENTRPSSAVVAESIYASMKSGDLHLRYDKALQQLVAEFSYMVEGNVDKHVNELKNIIAAEYVKGAGADPALNNLINDFVIPTEINVGGLSVDSDFSLEGGVATGNYSLEGLILRPPTTSAFMNTLSMALSDAPMQNATLTIRGGSYEHGYVEIIVPEAASQPTEGDARSATWTTNDLVNLDRIIFEVKSWPTPILTLEETSVLTGETVNIEGTLMQGGDPLPSQTVHITANGEEIGTAETDDVGRFSYAYEFSEAGTYEVATTLSFQGEKVESKSTALTVEAPTPEMSSLVLPAIGVVVVLATVLSFALLRRHRAQG